MTTSIYLIRHGEVYNPNNTLYGRLPGFQLSEKGKKEISQTGIFLKDKHIDFIYSSPMLRARQTAKIIQERLGIPTLHISKRLLEIKTSFQGKLFSDVSPDQSEIYLSPQRLQSDETVEQIAKRMQNFIQLLIKKHPGRRIVVISHGDPIMSLIATIKKLPMEFPSIRTGPYIKHGEVLLITGKTPNDLTIESVFLPL